MSVGQIAEQLRRARAAAAARAGHARGRRRQRERHELAADEARGALVVAAPRDAQHALRAARASVGGTVGPPSAFDTPVLDAPLVDLELGHLHALAQDRGGGLRLLVRVGPRERDARLARPARVRTTSSSLYVSVAGVPRTSVMRTRSSGRSSKCADVKSATTSGDRYARRVVHLVEQLVAQRVGARPGRPSLRLRDHRGAVGVDASRSGTAGPTGAGSAHQSPE